MCRWYCESGRVGSRHFRMSGCDCSSDRTRSFFVPCCELSASSAHKGGSTPASSPAAHPADAKGLTYLAKAIAASWTRLTYPDCLSKFSFSGDMRCQSSAYQPPLDCSPVVSWTCPHFPSLSQLACHSAAGGLFSLARTDLNPAGHSASPILAGLL